MRLGHAAKIMAAERDGQFRVMGNNVLAASVANTDYPM
jgi:hypothetical protein